MGADLTILKKYKGDVGGFEVSKKAVEGGYFRDAYNSYGLFSVLSASTGQELSWWRFTDEAQTNGWLDDEGDLKPEGAKVLLERLEAIKPLVESKTRLETEDWQGTPQILTEDDDKFTREWLDLLIEFLTEAVKLDSKIGWSV
jgi:hypothetical protein